MPKHSRFLFTPEAIASKPEWLRRQLFKHSNATTPKPNERKPAKPTRRARKASPAALDRAPRSEPEPSARNAPDAATQVEAFYPNRVLVRVESRRCGTQCDPDNIMVKWHIDALRYARILSDDTSAAIDLRVTETRVPTRAEEGVEITIEPLT